MTEYVFAVLTDIACEVAPVLHRYVPGPATLKLIVGVAQVNVALDGLMLTVGTVMSWKICMAALAVQPLAPVSVTE